MTVMCMRRTALAVAVLALGASAFGQHNLQRTITVDPQLGAADHQTITAALADFRIPANPSNRFTILIYAGTYPENVLLGSTKENIDLVGIDRDAVIIAPATGDGIVITSGTETSRNNSIRNLTIKTVSGHGIKIVKGGTPVPKDIIIEGVTIEANGDGKNGVYASEMQDLRIANCEITTTNGHGIEFVRTAESCDAPADILLHDVTIRAAGRGKLAIRADGAKGVPLKQRLRISDLTLYTIEELSVSDPAAPRKHKP